MYSFAYLPTKERDQKEIDRIFSQGLVYGVGVLTGGFKGRMRGNLQAQIVKNTWRSIAHMAMITALPPANAILATNAPFTVVLAAMAILWDRANYQDRTFQSEHIERVDLVSVASRFGHLRWQAAGLPSARQLWPGCSWRLPATDYELALLATAAKDAGESMAHRVNILWEYIFENTLPTQYEEEVQTQRQALVSAMQDGSMQFDWVNDVLVAQSMHADTLHLAFTQSPVVVVVYPRHRWAEDTYAPRVVISQFNESYINTERLAGALNTVSPMWKATKLNVTNIRPSAELPDFELLTRTIRRHFL